MEPMEIKTVDMLFMGRPKAHWAGRAPSAIEKHACPGEHEIGQAGFAQDQQADLSAHGGADMIIHHYPADHYAAWQDEGLLPPGSVPAAFGENISTMGMTERNVFIGDIYRIGTASVQVSQGRQPCWKLNAFTGQETMAYRFHKTGRTGWYYRVVETGKVQPGDRIWLEHRHTDPCSVFEVTRARLDKSAPPGVLDRLAQLPDLSEEWRKGFEKMQSTKDTV